MKEDQLREVIRKQIKKVLAEAPRLGAGGAELERGLGKIGGRTAKFSRRQKVQSIVPVLKKFNITANDLPYIKAALMKSAKADAAAAEEPEVEENYTAGVDDGDAGHSLQEGSLDSKGEKLEKTQAFQMLKRALGPKNANQQAEFVFDLIDKLGLDQSAKQKIRMKAQKNLK